MTMPNINPRLAWVVELSVLKLCVFTMENYQRAPTDNERDILTEALAKWWLTETGSRP